MNNDDSLTEDENFFDVYSARNTTNTYYNFLEIIRAEHEASITGKDQGGNTSNGTIDKGTTSQGVAASGRNNSEYIRDNISLSAHCVGNPFVQRVTRSNKKQNVTNSEINRSEREQGQTVPIEPLENEELNYEVSVKVLWKSITVKTFRHQRFQDFTPIFDYFSNKENVPFENILLQVRDTKITVNDTPYSLKLEVCDFIEGGILSNPMVPVVPHRYCSLDEISQSKTSDDENKVTIKIQGERKVVYRFSINKEDILEVIMVEYSEKVNVPLKKIKFYYDGELLKLTDTPAFLGMENGDIIDAICLNSSINPSQC